MTPPEPRTAGADPKKDESRRPPTLSLCAGTIPDELKTLRQWVRWRWTWTTKRACWTKVPVQATRNAQASSTKRKTWGSFAEALANTPEDGCSGIGFVFSEDDPYCGIDIDGCRDPVTGVLSDLASEVVAQLASYTEVSTTGTGVHVIVKAGLPNGAGRKGGCLEIYDRKRYFAFTGLVLGGLHAN